MELIEKKIDDLMAMHDWMFPADKLEKQVRMQTAIADIENHLEPLSTGSIAAILLVKLLML